jgi:GntR family transcriptional repressor for pyruvate dehydrogenase complex
MRAAELIVPTKQKTERLSASTNVLERLRKMIQREQMQPGAKLPPERILAAELKVGRPAIREAIKALQVLDVIDSRRGDGTYIKSLAGLSGGWPSKVELVHEDFDMIELLEVRKMFEPRATALAAARANAKQLQQIERELLAHEKNPEDRPTLERHDYLFHEGIISAAGNKVLLNVVRALSPLLIKSRSITGKTTPDVPKIARQHRLIFEAIRLGQSELAEQAMKDHLQTVALDLIAAKQV